MVSVSMLACRYPLGGEGCQTHPGELENRAVVGDPVWVLGTELKPSARSVSPLRAEPSLPQMQ